MDKEIRAHCLTGQDIRPADLQRAFRLSYSQACRALEELEALRLLGYQQGRRSTILPVNETRVSTFRKARGWQSAA